MEGNGERSETRNGTRARDRGRWSRAAAGRLLVLGVVLAGPVGRAAAHGGALGGAARESLTVPAWLVVGAGCVAVGVAAVLTGVGTDHELVDLHAARRSLPLPGRRLLVGGAGLLGVVVLAGVVVSGLRGPADPLSNPAVLVVWVGWWTGFAASTYLVGNAWPAVDPWRTIAAWLPDVGRSYRWRWGAWPSVAGLLALVWLELVGPLAEDPRVLAVTVVAYSAVTLTGAVVYGREVWFDEVDPVSRVFRLYGLVAPLGRGSDGLELRFPGGALAADSLAGRDEAAFAVTLLWVTTFDGLVTTPPWATVARAAVGAGVPPWALYLAVLVAGSGVFWGLYALAASLAERATGLPAATLARRFAPPLVAIAAASHLAQFLAFFLSLLPALALAVTAPMAVVDPPVLVVPDWFGTVAVATVLAGHVLAVAATRLVATDLPPGRRPARRSQYPFAAAAVVYTVVTLWVVTRPEVAPPFL